MNTLLIDADVLVHKVSRAAENPVRWNNGIWTWYADEQEALLILERYMNNLKEKLESDDVVMCLSSPTNYRHSIYPEYKAGRNNQDSYPPILKKFLREHFQENYTTFEYDDLEADDLLGILMTTDNYKSDCRKIICTIDKDLDTIPGWHYNLDKEDLYEVSDYDASFKLYTQALTGDRVDGIPGCPSYGDVTAKRLLNNTPIDEWWDAIIKCYEKKGLDEEFALTMARLVKILDATHWCKETKKPLLFTPIKKTTSRMEGSDTP